MRHKSFAELVINVEAPLEGTFHYHVARDLRPSLQVGHLVEVEFGKRLAQGIIIKFDDRAPVEDTKPIIALVDENPVVLWWQIELAKWMSQTYLTPLNACLRLHATHPASPVGQTLPLTSIHIGTATAV